MRRVDWVILVTLLVTCIVELTDGFSVRPGGFRISMRSSSRLFTLLTLMVITRHLAWRRQSFLDFLERQGFIVRDAAWRTPPFTLTAREVLAAGAFFIVLVAGALHTQVAAPWSVPDYGDPLFSTWRMAWVGHTLFTAPWRLFDANIFYPEPNTLAYSDSILVPSLFASAFFQLGVPRIVVYHIVLLTAMVSSGVTAYFLVSRLTGNRAAGLLSGTILALYPYRFEHYSHLELQMTTWMPLGLLFFHRLVQNARRTEGVALGAMLGLQLLSCLYFGIFFTLYLTGVGAVLLLLSRVRPLRPRLGALAISVTMLAAAAVPIAPPYLQNRERLGERSEAENVIFSASWRDFASPHPRSMFYGQRLPTGPPERALFPGVTPVLLAAVALVPPFTTVRAAYAVGLFLSVDAAMGYNAELYPVLYRWLLPLRGLRVPARFSVLVGLSLAILAGLALARLSQRLSRRAGWALAAAAMALTIVEYRPALALEPVWSELPAVYRPLVGRPPAVIAVFPMAKETSDNDAKYMYFSTWHWQRMVNGYSGNFPASYAELIARMRTFPSPAAIEYLRARQVEYIVLHGEFSRPEDYDKMAPVLDADPRLELMGTFPAAPRASRLYRMREPGASTSARPAP
jgi:hypothetical protein